MRESDLKIAFTGPESSGKTTLANWVAESFALKLSPEYAREYLQIHETYTQETLDIMAQVQFDRNNSAHVCVHGKIWKCEPVNSKTTLPTNYSTLFFVFSGYSMGIRSA